MKTFILVLCALLVAFCTFTAATAPCYMHLTKVGCPPTCRWSLLSDSCENPLIFTTKALALTAAFDEEDSLMALIQDLDESYEACLTSQQSGMNKFCKGLILG